MSFNESKECLLAGEHGIEPEGFYANSSKPRRIVKLRAYIPIFLLSVFLLASLFYNASLLLQVRTLKASLVPSQSKYGTSPFSCREVSAQLKHDSWALRQHALYICR